VPNYDNNERKMHYYQPLLEKDKKFIINQEQIDMIKSYQNQQIKMEEEPILLDEKDKITMEKEKSLEI
jgi:hypothetical protein